MNYQDAKQLMSDAKFYESYSRWDDGLGRFETWEEAVDRVMDMHKNYYSHKMNANLANYIEEATTAYKKRQVLGAQRALQFGGEQLLKHQMRLYNCVSGYADRAAFFGEFFYILLCGAGAGFSVQTQHVKKIPKLAPRTKQPKTHVVEDSIEGWATALDVLMSSYFVDGGKNPEYQGRKVYFDLSHIRPKGAKISGGFKAPGPDPLRKALDRVEYLLQGIVLNEDANVLRPIHVYDICMYAADAVLAGGVRRAATICLFSYNDKEMINAKTGNWFFENPQRARSNNSAMIDRNTITQEQFHSIMENIQEFGEPGFVFVDDLEITVNPCVPGDTRILTKDGYQPIIELVDEEVEVWNGLQWSTTKPFFTGVKDVYEVELSNGVTLKCTGNHKFVLKGNVRKELNNMKVGDKLEKFNMPIIRDGVEYDIDAYSQGFYSGDGNSGYDYSTIYEPKYPVMSRLTGTTYVLNEPNKMSWYHGKMESKNWVPHDASLSYKLNWLAGLLDADGCAVYEKNSTALQLTSIDKDFLMELRLMLTTMGVQAYIIKGYPERYTRFKNNQKKYLCKETYRLLINSTDTVTLVESGLKFNRLQLKGLSPNRNASRYVYVKSIDKVGAEPVYCFTEPHNNTGTFEGIVTGQCVEIGMYPKLGNKSGWEGCNLVEINGGDCDTPEKFYAACRSGSILGTIQAGYTDFKFVDDVTKKIFEREALLGVSITGWMNNPKVLFDEKVLKKGAEIVKQVNKEVAALIGINPAARTTCVKPSGNASVLLKTASGIHADHSPMYIRNVQMNKTSEVAKLLKRTNPYMVEESVWSTSKTDYVISFPVIPNKGSIYKDDLIGIKHLELVKKAQQNWVETGTNIDLCVNKKTRHNVSNTIIVDDWDEVEKYVFKNKAFFAGISFLPMSGDKDFNQAPNTKVITHKEIVDKYGVGAIFASGLIVDSFSVFDNLWEACSTARGYGDDISTDDHQHVLKRDWIRRFDKFAKNYFNSDYQKAEHCLKDVHLLHRWEKIQQNLKNIDWKTELTERKYLDIDTMGAAACAGVTESGEAACFV